MRTILAFALIALAFSGCLAGSGPEDAVVEQPTDTLSFAMPSGDVARAFIADYVMDHPFRSQNPAYASFMDRARVNLAAEVESMGHEVRLHDYGEGINILGIQNGTTDPHQWVVISAHYDTIDAGVGTTVYGAWDDGAGVGAVLALAEALAENEYPFSIVYAFFDGEEKGLVGSRHFVQDHFEDGVHDLVANINLDPPGLNWPCGDETGLFPVKIIHEMDKVETEPRFALLHDAIEAGLEAAAVPDEVRDYSPGIPIATLAGAGITGTSDHFNFGAVGVANVFVGGTPTTTAAEGTAALTYPLHTPLDTLQAMEARCTQGSLAEGLHTAVTVVAHALEHMATEGVPGG